MANLDDRPLLALAQRIFTRTTASRPCVFVRGGMRGLGQSRQALPRSRRRCRRVVAGACRTRVTWRRSPSRRPGSCTCPTTSTTSRTSCLAAELCRRTGMDARFFCNSGTEANEALLKLARHHFYRSRAEERVPHHRFRRGVPRPDAGRALDDRAREIPRRFRPGEGR